ncbi:MAG: type II toxin-antitoxin system death-on-curing family toxin [Roseiflexaceae bacterium]
MKRLQLKTQNSKLSMKYLTKDELLDLHAYVVMRYGGRLGIASQDRLTSAVDAPRQVLFETELYPDLPSKAAALTFLLIKNRPFLGANESTALLALLRFLDINGASLRDGVSDAELLWLVRAVNYSDLDKAGVERWLRDNTT